MIVTEAVRDLLAADGSIAALVGNRIYVDRVPRSGFGNAITISVTSANHEYNLLGEEPCPQAIIDVSVRCEGEIATYNREQIARRVRSVLSGYTGRVQTAGFGEIWIQGCTIVSQFSITDKPVDGSDNWIFRRSFDFRITYHDPV